MADKSKHDFRKIALVLITFLVFSVVLVFNQFASRKIIFPNDVGTLSRQFPLDITPLSIVFPIIWLTIYVWQTAWIVYTFTFLFRRVPPGTLVYRKIDLFNNGLFVAFILNNIGMIAWLFFWCYKFLEWSFVTLTFLTLCLYVAFYFALRAAYLYNEDLIRLELGLEIWATRVLVLNGLGFFLTWTTIASTLNMATYLTYDLGIDLTVATTTALLIIFAIMTIYFVMENFIWQKYLLYVFTPWVVVLVALVGSLLRNWNGTSPTRNNLISLIMLIFAVCFTVVKMVMFALYQTVCKPNVDRRESHKLLQAKENRST